MPCPDCKRKAEEVREMCAGYIESYKRPLLADEMARHLAYQIRQLNLTALDDKEGKCARQT